MKRNRWMRAGGLLVVLTLITSCFVGGTFAKYVTENEGMDTARVAKWGVEVTVTGDGFKRHMARIMQRAMLKAIPSFPVPGKKSLPPVPKAPSAA